FPLLLRIQSTRVLLIVYLQCINLVPLKAKATEYVCVDPILPGTGVVPVGPISFNEALVVV
ncbi:hypothetical protein M9458_025105, partial [Cirrhinus mrigala]